jgi:hypothetical protein
MLVFINYYDIEFNSMHHKIIFIYATLAVIWNGRFYILVVDNIRYVICKLCAQIVWTKLRISTGEIKDTNYLIK